MKEYFEKAIKNIARYGDTDIFPFPFERYSFIEKYDEVVSILEEIHSKFEESIADNPPLAIEEMAPVGYFGFRKATLIEPFWNAYFLGLVLSLADKIEQKRIPESESSVFSYRYEWDEEKNSLFKDLNWIDYKKQCVENAKKYSYVIQTDISDFYHRVNHHKLENKLKSIDCHSSDTTKKIMAVLSKFTSTISYGLPVGGPASRILAELALVHVDEYLKTKGIKFCRYVDDYTIFCKSESEAYKNILFLTQVLANDQLTLQKNKTKIMSSEEFFEIHKFLDPSLEENTSDEQKLLNVSIRFDPYSSSAEEDYDSIKKAITEIDIVGILSKEINKTRVDQIITKQAINSIKALETSKKIEAVKVLIDEKNLVTLTPVFTTILRAFRSIYDDLPSSGQSIIDKALLKMFEEDHYLTKINLNVSYMIQILSKTNSDIKTSFFSEIFEKTESQLIRRQVVMAMSNWQIYHWISMQKNNFSRYSTWEKRAIIYSSFFLYDEGRHWRKNNRKHFSKQEKLLGDWFGDRKNSNNMVLS